VVFPSIKDNVEFSKRLLNWLGSCLIKRMLLDRISLPLLCRYVRKKKKEKKKKKKDNDDGVKSKDA
jgi:hypothetical protein